MEKEKIKEKKIDILALWRSFITPAVEEASTEEVILNDSKLSETKKKELLKTLNKCDTIMGKISKSYTKDLKVDPKNLLNERKIISRSKEENKEENKELKENVTKEVDSLESPEEILNYLKKFYANEYNKENQTTGQREPGLSRRRNGVRGPARRSL